SRGVAVDLIVAGACALRPRVTGLSENVRVVAPTGRMRETSRIFAFGAGDDCSLYLSSADLAPRNLDRQVDVAVPIEHPELRRRVEEELDAMVAEAAWGLGPDGVWRRMGAGAEERL